METDFQDAMNNLIALQAELAAVSDKATQDWKRELVSLRRKLQAQLTIVQQLASRCEPLKRNPSLAHRFEDEFSRMRSALAYHQADWPAVQIDLANSDYVKSVSTVRDANRTFFVLAEEIVDFIKNS